MNLSTRSVRIPWLVSVALVLSSSSLAVVGDERPAANAVADLVITGGRVVTLDAQSRVVEAIALREGRIAATGSAVEIQKWIGPKTEVIRLEGKKYRYRG